MILPTSRDREAPMDMAITDKLIDANSELLRLAADHGSHAVVRAIAPSGTRSSTNRSERPPVAA